MSTKNICVRKPQFIRLEKLLQLGLIRPFGLCSTRFLEHDVINVPSDLLNFLYFVFKRNILLIEPVFSAVSLSRSALHVFVGRVVLPFITGKEIASTQLHIQNRSRGNCSDFSCKRFCYTPYEAGKQESELRVKFNRVGCSANGSSAKDRKCGKALQ